MEKGRLVEEGSHDTLLRDFPSGIYAKYVKEQEKAENNEQNAGATKNEDDLILDNEVLSIQEFDGLTRKASSVGSKATKISKEEEAKFLEADA